MIIRSQPREGRGGDRLWSSETAPFSAGRALSGRSACHCILSTPSPGTKPFPMDHGIPSAHKSYAFSLKKYLHPLESLSLFLCCQLGPEINEFITY